MNVIDFFKFIESKRPKYNAGKSIANYKSNRFSTPLNSLSKIDPETFEMNGWFTNDILNARYEHSALYNRYYDNGKLIKYEVVVNLKSIYGEVFLESTYIDCEVGAVIRRFKMMGEGRTEPFLNENPKREISNFHFLNFERDGGESRDFFVKFLINFFNEMDGSDIKWIEENVEPGVREALDYEDIEWLCEIINQCYNSHGDRPWQTTRMQFYLEKVFGSAAEYQIDEANNFFDGESGVRRGNINDVNVKWPFAHINIRINDVEEYERNRDETVEPEWDSEVSFYNHDEVIGVQGLKFNPIRKYIEMYPFKLED
jgi:hypothetical protein